MAKKKSRALTVAVTVLTVLQLVFIFSQSLLDAPASSEESGFVLKIVTPVLEIFVGKGNVTEAIVRKTAHFTEFAVLGALTAWLSYLLGKRRPLHYVFTLLCCLAAAVTDESIQLLVSGRSGEVRDVLIDFSGAAAGTAVIMIIILIINRIKGQTTNEKSSDN